MQGSLYTGEDLQGLFVGGGKAEIELVLQKVTSLFSTCLARQFQVREGQEEFIVTQSAAVVTIIACK